MRGAGLLALALLAVSGSACQAAGKTALPIKVPGFVRAGNGLPFQAAFEAGRYLTEIALHFAGLGPPLEWVPPSKSSEIFPDWVDEPIAPSAVLTNWGHPSCGEDDLGRLAQALKAEPSAAANPPRAQGLIRLDGPAPTSLAPSFRLEAAEGCLIPGG